MTNCAANNQISSNFRRNIISRLTNTVERPIEATYATGLPTTNVGEFDTSKSRVWQRFGELWRYRELVYRLTMKDIKLRYKGSFLGILWSWINPLLMMFVFYLVFNVILPPDVPKDCSETTPGLVGTKCRIYNHYAAFILTGILAWNFTSAAVSQGMMAVLGNASLIKKVYFPREVLTISTVLGIFVNFLLSFVVLFPIELINGVSLNLNIVLLPVVLAFHLLFMLGVALFLSALVVYFRDLTNIIEVLLTAWFFLTPVLYTMKQVYQSFNGIDTAQVVYWLNPIASFIELYRNILFFNYPTDPLFAVRTFASAIVTFVVGYVFFIKTTRSLGERL